MQPPPLPMLQYMLPCITLYIAILCFWNVVKCACLIAFAHNIYIHVPTRKGSKGGCVTERPLSKVATVWGAMYSSFCFSMSHDRKFSLHLGFSWEPMVHRDLLRIKMLLHHQKINVGSNKYYMYHIFIRSQWQKCLFLLSLEWANSDNFITYCKL